MSFRCPCCGHTVTAAVPREELAGHFGPDTVFGRIVQRLAWRPGLLVDMPDLVAAAYGACEDGGPVHAYGVIRTLMSVNRDKLRALGWRIERQPGTYRGYRLVLADQSDG